jgi:hypothetical protein
MSKMAMSRIAPMSPTPIEMSVASASTAPNRLSKTAADQKIVLGSRRVARCNIEIATKHIISATITLPER